MFDTLLESRALPQRRAGSSIASIVIHSAIITAGVIATARDVIAPREAEVTYHRVAFQKPPERAPLRPTPAGATRASVASLPSMPRLDAPRIVPVGIPAIDLTAVATPSDFQPGPVASGPRCLADCGALPIGTGGGSDVLSGRELMMRLAGEPQPPRYPESLRRAGVEGDVVVRFVVDTMGRVDPRSVEVLESTHEMFTAAVRDALARLRFTPSASGERKLAALAVMPFRFRLR